ncbi:MAG: bifunctional diaminohydroxyphosphoribosylaminopyrimidine deaminase/5-amino-6-(5-phosphoribosylamino)uracil reductase RibD [Elusimicrobia bacterium]|nr:bifunctional diaminohydroxyphosphoribosylaminopyrimidine deaminase/5-amino-6-(5-phosphoribosylamino)uracil reductase RibD [Elusimicrobiota bacterium]MDE2313459.1 bifunctional diaminohydroxyphosphoribosylaminopyrimidine deaminase/5-amino-6-(5-phosphoribosylamino)uracil reductase RibD [Elusimicrobiota bacterium]
MMRRALALARRGGKAVFPNPMVGCVLAKGGRVLAEGWHPKLGGPHAEAAALKIAGSRAKGATAYVTLEPCMAHPGKKNPSCAELLARAGVSRVVAAAIDPNPAVSGKGLALLRRAKIAAESGLLAAEARSLSPHFFARMKRKRPYVILKMALSLDGRAFSPGGASRWITDAPARNLVHDWRAQAQAVMVGSGTALADNPALTSHGAGKNPLRVVMDTRLRLPRKSRLLDGSAPTIVFTASRRKIPGAETVRIPKAAGGLNLRAALKELCRRGINTLLVEGGPTLHAAFLARGLADEARVFIAPKMISGSRDPNAAPTLPSPRLKKMGSDFLISGRLSCSRG